MTKILVVSDTHSEEELLNKVIDIEQPNYIIHAGDHGFSEQYLLDKNIIFVKGNNDHLGQEEQILTINKIKICVTHGNKQFNYFDWHKSLFYYFNEYNPNIIIYGHSHKEVVEKYNDKLWIINPGSLNFPRNIDHCKTYIVIEISSSNLKFNIKKLF